MRPCNLQRSSRLALLAVLVSIAGAGCHSHRADRDAKTGPDVLYNKAHKSLDNQSYGEAIKQLENITSRFPFSEPAKQARIDLIYAYYKNHATEQALDAADTFIRENPTNPHVDYAYYMKGLVNFERQPNWMERKFHVDLSARPPAEAKKSYDAFQTLIKHYPHSEYAPDARQRMVYLRNRLAGYELSVAQYYMRRAAYVGALNRARYCIENYDGAPAVQPALAIMIDAYRALGMNDLAANAERVYRENYPTDARAIEPKKHWWRRLL